MQHEHATAKKEVLESLDSDLLVLRMTLVQGKLIASRALARHLESELASRGVDDTSMYSLVGQLAGGIEALADGDQGSALQLLEQPMADSNPPWIRWVAFFWLAQWSARTGNLDDAEEYGATAMELARQLDDETTNVTQCMYAELEALDGAIQPALDRLAEALDSFEVLGETAGIALAWLTYARIYTRSGLQDEALVAAERAYQTDPTWEATALFRSQQLVAQGNLPDAAELLHRLPAPHSREVQRELQIISSVETRGVPLWVVAELQALRDEPPSEPTVEQLEILVGQASGLPHARETLAWKLFQLGDFEKSREQFELLSQEDLGLELREAALLGKRCATNAQQRQLMIKDSAQVEDTEPAPVSGDMFRGDLSLLRVMDLLEFLRATRRSGLLVLAAEQQTGTICLQQGLLAGAASPKYRHLGERLHSSGEISAEILATLEPREPTAALGWVSVPPTVPETKAKSAFSEQIRFAIKELIGWNRGRFSFEPRNPCRKVGLGLSLDIQGVLLEALRQIDEEQAGRA